MFAWVKGAGATCVEAFTERKKCLVWNPSLISMFSEIFSPYKHVWQRYLGNKEPIFPACIHEQVYAAILESSKNNNLFQNRQN